MLSTATGFFAMEDRKRDLLPEQPIRSMAAAKVRKYCVFMVYVTERCGSPTAAESDGGAQKQ